MKKIFTFAILAIAILFTASCSKDAMLEQPVASAQKAIAFDNFLHKATKATSATAASIQANGFNVSAYYNNGNDSKYFFEDLAVTYTAADGDYKTTYYWPSTGTMDFFAVYPKSYSISDKTIAYTASGAEDLLAAVTMSENCTTHYGADTPVALEFNHVLTQIYFQAAGDNADLDYVISKITVNANKTATYTYASTTKGIGSWGTASIANTYTYNNATKKIEGTRAEVYGSKEANSLMLIPQNDAVVTVEYKVYQRANEVLIADFTGDNAKSFTVGTAWQPKQSILYSMTLPSGTKPIRFTAEVKGWDADTTVTAPTWNN